MKATVNFCEQQNDRQFLNLLKKLTGSNEVKACVDFMRTLSNNRDSNKALIHLAQSVRQISGTSNAKQIAYYEEILRDRFFTYRQSVPVSLTTRLSYPPDSWNVLRMLSATVAHASWLHLIGNLIFFFAFAATLETLLKPALYFLVLLFFSISTHIIYSIAMIGESQALPTVGLSGVVMAVIALFTYFLPHASIRCFLWLGILSRRISLPALFLTIWYVGWDIYTQLKGVNSEVNLIAHLAGVVMGLSIGIIFFRRKRAWTKELVEEN